MEDPNSEIPVEEPALFQWRERDRSKGEWGEWKWGKLPEGRPFGYDYDERRVAIRNGEGG